MKVVVVDPENRSVEMHDIDKVLHKFAEEIGIGDPGGYMISRNIAIFCDDMGLYTVPETNWFLLRGHSGWFPGKTVFYRCDNNGFTVNMTERDLFWLRHSTMFRLEGLQ